MYRLFDNEGITIDRYTLVNTNAPLDDKDHIFECFSFSETPSNPQGYWQWSECVLEKWDNKHLWKEIVLEKLKPALQKFLNDNILDNF